MSHCVGGWNIESIKTIKHQTQFIGPSLPCVPTSKLSYVFNLTFSRFTRWLCKVYHLMSHHARIYYYSSKTGYIYNIGWMTHLCIYEFYTSHFEIRHLTPTLLTRRPQGGRNGWKKYVKSVDVSKTKKTQHNMKSENLWKCKFVNFCFPHHCKESQSRSITYKMILPILIPSLLDLIMHDWATETMEA